MCPVDFCHPIVLCSNPPRWDKNLEESWADKVSCIRTFVHHPPLLDVFGIGEATPAMHALDDWTNNHNK